MASMGFWLRPTQGRRYAPPLCAAAARSPEASLDLVGTGRFDLGMGLRAGPFPDESPRAFELYFGRQRRGRHEQPLLVPCETLWLGMDPRHLARLGGFGRVRRLACGRLRGVSAPTGHARLCGLLPGTIGPARGRLPDQGRADALAVGR